LLAALNYEEYFFRMKENNTRLRLTYSGKKWTASELVNI
jgi:hypothetical protein